MQGIILCGGLGTRLRSVIGETQKTMVVTNGEPFLVNVMLYLKQQKVDDVIFATGYKSDEVRQYFGEKYYFGMKVSYAVENTPLGTGGAIRNCLPHINCDEVVVVNGDTLFPANIKSLVNVYKKYNSDISIVCKSKQEKSRYGTIKIKNPEKESLTGNVSGVIEEFAEKVVEKIETNEDDINNSNDLVDAKNLQNEQDLVENETKKDTQGEEMVEEKYINGGVYLMKKTLIEEIPENQVVSLEKDLIPKWLVDGKVITGVVSDASFIDIGTPESLDLFKHNLAY